MNTQHTDGPGHNYWSRTNDFSSEERAEKISNWLENDAMCLIEGQKGEIVLCHMDDVKSVEFALDRPHSAFIASAVNAFISAGEKLGINPIVLAERLEKGGIAEVVEALQLCEPIIDAGGEDACFVEQETASALSLVRGE